MRRAHSLLIGTTLTLAVLLGGCGGADSTTAHDDAPTTGGAAPTFPSGDGTPSTATPTADQTASPVKQSDVEDQISQKLAEAGAKPSSVHCPGDLAGKEGSTLECTLLLDGAKTSVLVTVTSIDADTVNFNIELEDAGE